MRIEVWGRRCQEPAEGDRVCDVDPESEFYKTEGRIMQIKRAPKERDNTPRFLVYIRWVDGRRTCVNKNQIYCFH